MGLSISAFSQEQRLTPRLTYTDHYSLFLKNSYQSPLFAPVLFKKSKQSGTLIDPTKSTLLPQELFATPTIDLGNTQLKILPNLDWDTKVQFSFKISSSKKK